MRPLNEKEQLLLDKILADETTLINFFVSSNNPLFLRVLAGQNSKHRNIFQEGCLEEDLINSRFLLPIQYVERIAQNWKDQLFSPELKEEYRQYILSATKSVIRGASQESIIDYNVVRCILHILTILEDSLTDRVIYNFIQQYIAKENINEIINDLLTFINTLSSNHNSKGLDLFISILQIISNNILVNDSIYFHIKKFIESSERILSISHLVNVKQLNNIALSLLKTMNFSIEQTIDKKFKITILGDASIQVSLLATKTNFILPQVPLLQKEKIIKPLIVNNLQTYNDPDKERLIELIFHYYTHVWYDLTYITYPSLYDNLPSSSYREGEKLLIYFLKELLCTILKEKGLRIFSRYYNCITKTHQNFIFKRILLYCYGKNFNLCRKYICSILFNEKSLLFSSEFEAEIYYLFKHNANLFTQKEIDFLGHLIDDGPYEEVDWLDEDKAKDYYHSRDYKNRWQQKQYSALTDINVFNEKYQKLCKNLNDKEFFNFRDGFKAKWIQYQAAWPDEETLKKILSYSNIFIQDIETFEQTQQSHSIGFEDEKPTIEGNITQIKRLGKTYPKEITSNIDKFKTLKPIYIEYLMFGLQECKNPQDIMWDKLLKFIEFYVTHIPNDTFSEDQLSALFRTSKKQEGLYIISKFADVIPANPKIIGVDCNKFIEYLQNILKTHLSNYRLESKTNDNENNKNNFSYLDSAIRTPLGRILEKYILLCINLKKLNEPDFQNLYQLLLKQKVVEAYVLFGHYFAYFQKQIKTWANTYARTILDMSSDDETKEYWSMFFDGFIKGNLQFFEFYDEMYNHYKKAIEIQDSQNLEYLTKILTQFVLDKRDILDENSLLRYCYQCHSFNLLASCVRRITYRAINDDNPSEEAKKGIKQVLPMAKKLWEILQDKICTDFIQNDKKPTEAELPLFQAMLKLVLIVDAIDAKTCDLIKWLIDVCQVKHLETSDIFAFLIKRIKNKPNKSLCNYIAKIYCQVIKKINYLFPSDQHQQIVLFLRHCDILSVKGTLKEIEATYSKKHWNQGLKWFTDSN